jgi:hypothetical protein
MPSCKSARWASNTTSRALRPGRPIVWAPTAAPVPHGSGLRAVGVLQVIKHGRRPSGGGGGLPPRNADPSSATLLHQKSSKNSVFPRPSESAAAFENFHKKPIFADTYLPAFSSITIWAEGSRDRPCEFRLRICPKPGEFRCGSLSAETYPRINLTDWCRSPRDVRFTACWFRRCRFKQRAAIPPLTLREDDTAGQLASKGFRRVVSTP